VSLPSVDPQRVAIGGESAGGGLAAALAFMVRDRGEISPVLQLMSYPMLDDRTVSNPAVARNYRLWNERSRELRCAVARDLDAPTDIHPVDDRLQRLQDLHAAGMLTDDEFETQRQRIIGT
jgi:acetyl esterase/lipase